MTWARALLVFAGLAAAGLLAGFVIIQSGVYNVAATRQHTAPVFWLLERVKHASIRQRAEDIIAPNLSDPAMIARGEHQYQRVCQQCHGAPGIAPDALGRGMTPVPSNLVQSARDHTASEIFWVVKYGIKSTGMPAWDYRLPDDRIWEIVAFVEQMPYIVPAEYRRGPASRIPRAPAPAPDTGDPNELTAPGDPSRGKIIIGQYACTACHMVPGVVGPDTWVGPPLRGIGSRRYIAGVIENTPENMIRWLRAPTEVDELTAMPDLGVSEAHARDIAAYLSSLD